MTEGTMNWRDDPTVAKARADFDQVEDEYVMARETGQDMLVIAVAANTATESLVKLLDAVAKASRAKPEPVHAS
jgi:hypothetical protein